MFLLPFDNDEEVVVRGDYLLEVPDVLFVGCCGDNYLFDGCNKVLERLRWFLRCDVVGFAEACCICGCTTITLALIPDFGEVSLRVGRGFVGCRLGFPTHDLLPCEYPALIHLGHDL